MADPNQPSDDFFNQFLDDYFAECEEHLAAVRRGLLNIEHFVDRPEIDNTKLDELFRSFHTMKGISGMVGLTQAEQLAHEMESYLRVLRKGDAQLSKDGFEALLDGTRVLGEVVEAHRVHTPIPDITKSVVALTYAVTNSKTDTAPKQVETATNVGEGKREWRVLFVPSKERADAGINVNSVRSHLSSLGEITRTTPLVEKGDVAFEFVLATSASETDLTDLHKQGVTFSLLEPPPDVVSNTSHSQSPMASVRVDLARLDQLMLQVGELVVTRARLEQGLNSIRTTVGPSSWRQLQEINVALGKQLRDLRNDVMRVRMVPIAEVFERMRFVVRDVAKETQKRVDLELSGQETEIDKFLVERLMDPLLHLVRNSISHGIESEKERVNAGKTAVGHVFLRAQTSGELVVIELGDDGRGIDVEAIEESLGRQLRTADGEINFSELLKLISEPGFSTRKHADRASGRGVGMDVVSRAIKDLDGHLTVRTEPSVGTTFRIELPLTLAITDALIATVAGQTFAIHRSSVQEVIEVDVDSVKVFENNEVIIHREDVLPLVRLSNVFKLQGKKEGLLNAFVIGTGANATGLVVDKVLGLREVVVRSLPDPLTAVPGVSGATELGDGRPVLILDIGRFLTQPGKAQFRNELKGPLEKVRTSGKGLKFRTSSIFARALKSQTVMASTAPTTESEEYVLFELMKTSYAVRSSAVSRLEMVENVTPVPNATEALEGVVLSRGRIIPAVNLRSRFGFSRIAYDLRTRLIVVEADGRMVGLIVDAAREFTKLAASEIKPPPDAIANLNGDYLEGIANINGRVILVLKLEEILKIADEAPANEAAN